MSRAEAFAYRASDPTPPSEQLHQTHQPPKGQGEQLQRKADEAHRKRQEEMAKLDFI